MMFDNFNDILIEDWPALDEAGITDYDKSKAGIEVIFNDGTIKKYNSIRDFLRDKVVADWKIFGSKKYYYGGKVTLGTKTYSGMGNAYEAVRKAIKNNVFPQEWGIKSIKRLVTPEGEAVITLSKTEIESLSVRELSNKFKALTADGKGYYSIKITD